MTINLTLKEEPFLMEATTDDGHSITFDHSPEGETKAIGPMQAVAASVAGCSSVDVLHILRKGRHRIERYAVEVDAERRSEPVPKVFQAIHLHFLVDGDVPAEALRRAIELSLGTYCSVAKMIDKTAEITYSFVLNGEEYAGEEVAQS